MINLAYDDNGTGEPVLFIAGRGGAGRTWHLHQVPAFLRAGYRVITFDNRGIGATENADGLHHRDDGRRHRGADREAGRGPVRIVAVSMGSFIAQELMLARPELVQLGGVDGHPRPPGPRPRVLPRRRGRARRRPASSCPPPTTRKCGCWRASRPRRSTTTSPSRDWIDMFTMWPTKPTPGIRAPARRRARRTTGCPLTEVLRRRSLVIGFADDVVLPPHLGREVADAMPERPLPGDSRHRAPRVHRAARGGQRRGAEILRATSACDRL